MRVVLLAVNARGAMAHYLDGLAPPLAQHVDLTVVAPAHYAQSAHIGVPIEGFPGPRSRAARALMLANPFGASAIWDSIARLRPDVIHMFNGSDLPWGAVVAHRARQTGIPVLVTIHSPVHLPGNPWWMANSLVRVATKRATTAFHVHADVWRRKLVQSGVDEASIYVIPHGSFAPRFARHAARGVRREPMAVVFGRIRRYKGIDDVVAATPRFPEGMRTAIAGPGRLSRRARRMIGARPELYELHLGYQPDERITNLLQRASVCVFPHRQSTQSSGPLIAACLGVPVVGTNAGALAEDVPLVNGVVVPPRDVQALAAGVARAVGTEPSCPPERDFSALAGRFADAYRGVATA